MFWVFYVCLAGFLAYHRQALDGRARILTLGVVAVAHLGIWHFASFVLRLLDSELFTGVVVSSLFAVSTFGILTLLIRRPLSMRAILTGVAVGLTGLIVARVNEGRVKNVLAQQVGYYSASWPVVSSNQEFDTFSFMHPEGHYTVDIPTSWQPRVHDSGFRYFVRGFADAASGRDVEAKLWLTCAYDIDPSVPEVVETFRSTVSGLTSRCASRGDQIACHLDYHTDVRGRNEVVRRFLMRATDQSRGVDLQLQTPGFDADVWAEIDAVFASLELLPLPVPSPACISSMEWF